MRDTGPRPGAPLEWRAVRAVSLNFFSSAVRAQRAIRAALALESSGTPEFRSRRLKNVPSAFRGQLGCWPRAGPSQNFRLLKSFVRQAGLSGRSKPKPSTGVRTLINTQLHLGDTKVRLLEPFQLKRFSLEFIKLYAFSDRMINR